MAYEDFTTFTRVDYENFNLFTESDGGNDITIDSDEKVSWVNAQTRTENYHVYKDYGANYFDGDFSHLLELQFDNVGNAVFAVHWAITNAVGDSRDWGTANSDGARLESFDDTEALRFWIIENGSIGGAIGSDSWAAPGPQPATTYYTNIERDDDGGANSAGQYTIYIRTGSHTGTLQDTLTADCSAGEQHDLRYLYVMAGYDDSANANTCDGFTQNLDINEVVDVESSTKVSWDDLDSRQRTVYVYKDYGANHFDGDFEHLFECQFSNVGSASVVNMWMLSNSVGDQIDLRDASEDFLAFLQSGANSFYLQVGENGTPSSDGWIAGPSGSTTYYVTVERDDDAGANNTGQTKAYIRTGSHTGTLQDTLSVDSSAGEQNDFRYLYAVATFDDNNNTNDTDGFTQNLDLQEAVAAGAPTGALYGPLVGPLGGPI